MDSTAIVIIVIVLIVLIAGIGVLLFSRRARDEDGSRLGRYTEAPPPKRAEPPDNGTYRRPAVPPQPAPPEPSRNRTGTGLFEDQTPLDGSPPPPRPQQAPAPAREAAPPPKDTQRSLPPAPPVSSPQPAPIPIGRPAPKPEPGPLASPAPEPAKPAAKPEEAPAIPTEAVRFTVFHPKEVAVERWYTLLTYTHIETVLAQVQADAARFKEEMGGTPRQAQSGAPAQLARGTEITIVPQIDGVEFNPERITFKWVENMHRSEFRLRAAKPLAGLAGSGTVSILVGPVIVATIKIGMLFDEDDKTIPLKDVAPAQATAEIYKADKIFISYSHKDTPVANACRAVYKALGYDVLIDIDSLRSGENWTDALMKLIDRADIFQLFWSQNSAQSVFCRQEWQYALQQEKLKGDDFIRPVFWEQPLVTPPEELESLHFAYVPLPKADTDPNVH